MTLCTTGKGDIKKVAVAMLSLRLGFQKLLDIFDALLRCHSHDVVQGIHVAQHLHNLFQQLPGSRQIKKKHLKANKTKQTRRVRTMLAITPAQHNCV